MRKISLLLLVTVCMLSCKKKDNAPDPFTCATCVKQPQAIAANDALSKGIYKGVFIGSTGTILFNILNNNTTITATMIIDGVTTILTSNVTWVAGVAYVAPFTGTLNGQAVTINFSVSPSGTSPMVTSSSIPGHPNASFEIVKETSNALLECFEGTYTTTLPETGTFNLILSRPLAKWSAVARKTGATTTSSTGTGTISNNKLMDPSSPNRVIGTLSSDDLNGSFMDSNGSTVTIKGKRTL